MPENSVLDVEKAKIYKGFMVMYFGNGSGNPLADRRYELALHLAEGGDFRACADLLVQALDLAPHWPPLHFHLGEALRNTGRPDIAKEAFLAYLELDPEDKMGGAIKLALLGATPAPDIMPEGYVRSLFDQYAPRFEKVLVDQLSYHAPEMMAEEIIKLHPENFYHILDLGCGTGLAAGMFLGKAQKITGVDLAPTMIQLASEKNIFTDLHICSVEEFLSQDRNTYDLVLAGDVFVYIGALEHLFSLISDHMCKDALFSFSTQKLENGTWELGADHRYGQSQNYIKTCANNAGLNILVAKDIPLRLDAGEFIPGQIFVCQKL